MTGFVEGMQLVLASQVTKFVVLGEKAHGKKALFSLAKAVEDGALKPLSQYGVSTVLFEGPTRGQELSYDNASYRDAIETLATKGVRVVGCEDDESLSTHSAMDQLFLKASSLGSKEFMRQQVALLDRRVPDANDAWLKQALRVKPKVIICCGTSHLPEYHHVSQGHVGLVKKLHQHGCCYGFAIEASNTDSDFWYEPEKGTGNFGRVETLDPYPGWDD